MSASGERGKRRWSRIDEHSAPGRPRGRAGAGGPGARSTGGGEPGKRVLGVERKGQGKASLPWKPVGWSLRKRSTE